MEVVFQKNALPTLLQFARVRRTQQLHVVGRSRQTLWILTKLGVHFSETLHTWWNSIKTHKKRRGLSFLDILNLFERPLHFYRPIKIAQVSLGEIWDWNFLSWQLGIYLGISWWFYCKWRQRGKWLRVNSRLSWALLPADSVAICLVISLKSQNLTSFLDFHLFLKRTLGQINKNYTKNQFRKNCSIYVKIEDLLFF